MKLLKTTVPLEDFLPHVIAATIDNEGKTSLPENAAISYIRNAAITFARRTQILKDTIYVDLQCGLTDYPIETSDCEKIVSIKSAKFSDWEVEDCGLGWSFGEVNFKFADDVLRISPAPNKDIPRSLELEVVTVPNRDACELDSRLYDQWHDTIVNGALASIHAMPSRSWSSMSRADYLRKLFNEEIGEANVDRVMDGHDGPLRMSIARNWSRNCSRQYGW